MDEKKKLAFRFGWVSTNWVCTQGIYICVKSHRTLAIAECKINVCATSYRSAAAMRECYSYVLDGERSLHFEAQTAVAAAGFDGKSGHLRAATEWIVYGSVVVSERRIARCTSDSSELSLSSIAKWCCCCCCCFLSRRWDSEWDLLQSSVFCMGFLSTSASIHCRTGTRREWIANACTYVPTNTICSPWTVLSQYDWLVLHHFRCGQSSIICEQFSLARCRVFLVENNRSPAAIDRVELGHEWSTHNDDGRTEMTKWKSFVIANNSCWSCLMNIIVAQNEWLMQKRNQKCEQLTCAVECKPRHFQMAFRQNFFRFLFVGHTLSLIAANVLEMCVADMLWSIFFSSGFLILIGS